jgi:hypothetical protein
METEHAKECPERTENYPEHLTKATELIVRYAMGKISYQEYRLELDNWWEKNEEAWQENDLSTLFLIVCLTN